MTAHTRFLIDLAEVYRREAEIAEGRPLALSTVSHRVFRGQNDKLAKMQDGGDIKTGLFLSAVKWLDRFWPPGRPKPLVLTSAAKAPAAWAALISAYQAGASPFDVSADEAREPDQVPPTTTDYAVRLRDLAESGQTINGAADELGVTATAIRNAALRHGLKFRAQRRPRAVNSPIAMRKEVAGD